MNRKLNLGCVSGSAIVENEQIELFFQFDDDEPISAMRCNGNKFTMKMIPVKNNFVTFTDGKKTMKLFVKRCTNKRCVQRQSE